MPLSFPLPARLAAFYFAYFAHVAAYAAYFPLYLASRGLEAGEIAFVLALPQAARIFAPGAWGGIADRFGAQRGVIVTCCAVMAAGLAALPVAPGFAAIALLVGVTGLFSSGVMPLVEAVTFASIAGAPGRYGPVRLWGSVGFIAVVLAGGVWLDVGSVNVVPAALVGGVAVALLIALSFPGGRRHSAQAVRFALPPGARAVLGGGFFMVMAHGALYAFLTLHLQRLGYSGTAIGFFWTLGVLAEIGVFAYLPALFLRYRLSSILMFSFACAALRFVAIGWAASELWILCLAQLLHAATFGSFHAASVAAIHRIFPEHAQGRGQALFSSVCYGAGGAAGALLAGWTWEAWGPQITFTVAGLAGLAGAHFAYLLKRSGH